MYAISKSGNAMTITPETGNIVTYSTPMAVSGNVDRILLSLGGEVVFQALLADIDTIDDIAPAETLEDVIAQVAACLPDSNFTASPVLEVPTSLVATPGDTIANLDWTNAAGTGTTELQVSENADFSESTTYNIVAPTSDKDLTGLENDVELHWRVRHKAPNYLRSAWVIGTPFTPVAEEI